MDDKIITLEHYYDPMLAHIIRTRLESNGIDCFIEDDNMAGLNPLFNQAGGIKLNVFERDLPRCKDILAEDHTLPVDEHTELDPETQETMICPFCASTNIGRIESDRPDWLNSVNDILSSVFPFYTLKQWHCYNCRQEFE